MPTGAAQCRGRGNRTAICREGGLIQNSQCCIFHIPHPGTSYVMWTDKTLAINQATVRNGRGMVHVCAHISMAGVGGGGGGGAEANAKMPP